MTNKKIILLLAPVLALACGFSRSALLVPFPTQPLPSPTIAQAETQPPHPTHQQPTHVCTVAAENLHLRASPGLDGVVIGWLKAGDVLTILDQPEGDWIHVRSGDLTTGWINSNYCERIIP